jgi:hypothetical protein
MVGTISDYTNNQVDQAKPELRPTHETARGCFIQRRMFQKQVLLTPENAGSARCRTMYLGERRAAGIL